MGLGDPGADALGQGWVFPNDQLALGDGNHRCEQRYAVDVTGHTRVTPCRLGAGTAQADPTAAVYLIAGSPRSTRSR